MNDAALRVLRDDVRRFVARRVPEAEVDDVVQDVFERLLRNRDAIRSDERVNGWVFRVARNAANDWHRASRPHVPLLTDLADPAPEDEAVLAQRLARWMATIIPSLPERYREVLVLTELEQRPYAQVADRLGLTVSGVKTRVQRGRALLRGELDQCCEVVLDARGGVREVTPRVDCCPG